MVAVGETLAVPAMTEATAPTPVSIEKLVTCMVVHERVEESPACTVAGLAESVQVGASGGGELTVAEQFAVLVSAPEVTVTVPVLTPGEPYVFDTVSVEPDKPSVPPQL